MSGRGPEDPGKRNPRTAPSPLGKARGVACPGDTYKSPYAPNGATPHPLGKGGVCSSCLGGGPRTLGCGAREPPPRSLGKVEECGLPGRGTREPLHA